MTIHAAISAIAIRIRRIRIRTRLVGPNGEPQGETQSRVDILSPGPHHHPAHHQRRHVEFIASIVPPISLDSTLANSLPEVVSERKIRPTTDTPENRFVKAFIGQARTIIGRMRSAVSSRGPDAFRRNLLRDCDRMEASLMPIARHSMWEEVARMVRIPFTSTVLQRRRGYRRVLQHFSRIRLAPMIPLDKDGMRDLLELKNIALLYELWTFFRLVHEISAVLGSPPVRSGRLASDLFQTAFAAGGTFEWDPGVRLVYNQRFSRSRRGQRHSYSVPLIPDIALRVPDGPNAGLHLFDAKFRVQALTDVGLAADDKEADDEKAESGRVRSSVQTSTRCTPTATRFRTPGRCGSCTRGAVSVLWGAGGWRSVWAPGGFFT